MKLDRWVMNCSRAPAQAPAAVYPLGNFKALPIRQRELITVIGAQGSERTRSPLPAIIAPRNEDRTQVTSPLRHVANRRPKSPMPIPVSTLLLLTVSALGCKCCERSGTICSELCASAQAAAVQPIGA